MYVFAKIMCRIHIRTNVIYLRRLLLKRYTQLEWQVILRYNNYSFLIYGYGYQ